MKFVAILALVFAIVIAVAFAGEESNQSNNPRSLEQRPIGLSARRRVRKIGASCQYSWDCASGCCRKIPISTGGSRKRCAPKALAGQRCSDGQVKLDVYLEHCPCEAGNDHCVGPDYVCAADPFKRV